jgi:hypothetical protein
MKEKENKVLQLEHTGTDGHTFVFRSPLTTKINNFTKMR